jgi:hypothetical protein
MAGGGGGSGVVSRAIAPPGRLGRPGLIPGFWTTTWAVAGVEIAMKKSSAREKGLMAWEREWARGQGQGQAWA